MVERCSSTGKASQNGSALAAVVVTAGVLFLMVGVAYVYFTMGVSSGSFRMNRIKALTAAEAGIALTIHDLSLCDTFPPGDSPRLLTFGGDSSGLRLEGTGSVFTIADPIRGLSGRWSNGAFEIRSRGTAGDVSIDVHARTAPAYVSSFALLTDVGIPQGFLADGRIINGPVHSNGVIHFSSATADTSDDPLVEMISTSAEGGFFFSGAGEGTVPHPEGSTVWVRPYAHHVRGLPTWDPYSPEIDFSRMDSYFRDLAREPAGNGVLRIDAERVLIESERIAFKGRDSDPESYASLDGVHLVVLSNGFSPVWIRGTSIPEHPVTIMTTGDMLIAGSLDGGASGAGGPMGLVALGDVIIAADPDLTGAPDWQGRWTTETDGSLSIRACLAVPSGNLRAAVPGLPRGSNRITVSGSLAERSMGRLSTATGGYELGISWDRGLLSVHPPAFPLTGRWNIFSWTPEVIEEDADLIYENRV